MKTAIVHEWFLNYMGSEKCVESFNNIWKDADNFALIDFLEKEERQKILNGKKAGTTFIQKLPKARTSHRHYLPLYPMAIEQLDLSAYDLVVSSSHSVAKGALTNSNQLHICYCHTPMRYAWDLYHQYIRESGLKTGLKGAIAKYILHKMRTWDFISSNRVDYFLANSKHIAKRIKKIYNRDAEVIYPPVDVKDFPYYLAKENYYLTVARFVPYKKVDLIVKAFSQMPDKELVVIGSGPDEEKIKSLGSSNIKFVGYQAFPKLVEYMQRARAFVFAAEEDFGITIVEAQSCGTPVVAYKVGGASETVMQDKTGVLFDEQSVKSLLEAVKEFETKQEDFDSQVIHEHARRFSRENFESNIKDFVKDKYNLFYK